MNRTCGCEIFSGDANQVVNSQVFAAFTAFAAFFDKIKADNRKWLFVAKKTVKQVNSKKYVDMGIRSPIQRSKRLVEIFKYMQSRSIEMEKIREITESAVFPSFLAPTFFSLFC